MEGHQAQIGNGTNPAYQDNMLRNVQGAQAVSNGNFYSMQTGFTNGTFGPSAAENEISIPIQSVSASNQGPRLGFQYQAQSAVLSASQSLGCGPGMLEVQSSLHTGALVVPASSALPGINSHAGPGAQESGRSYAATIGSEAEAENFMPILLEIGSSNCGSATMSSFTLEKAAKDVVPKDIAKDRIQHFESLVSQIASQLVEDMQAWSRTQSRIEQESAGERSVSEHLKLEESQLGPDEDAASGMHAEDSTQSRKTVEARFESSTGHAPTLELGENQSSSTTINLPDSADSKLVTAMVGRLNSSTSPKTIARTLASLCNTFAKQPKLAIAAVDTGIFTSLRSALCLSTPSDPKVESYVRGSAAGCICNMAFTQEVSQQLLAHNLVPELLQNLENTSSFVLGHCFGALWSVLVDCQKNKEFIASDPTNIVKISMHVQHKDPFVRSQAIGCLSEACCRHLANKTAAGVLGVIPHISNSLLSSHAAERRAAALCTCNLLANCPVNKAKAIAHGIPKQICALLLQSNNPPIATSACLGSLINLPACHQMVSIVRENGIEAALPDIRIYSQDRSVSKNAKKLEKWIRAADKSPKMPKDISRLMKHEQKQGKSFWSRLTSGGKS